MISKMTRYDFVLLAGERESFLNELQELGVVDIARSSKPVDEKSAAMLDKTSRIRRAISLLETLDYSKDADVQAIETACSAMSDIEGCKMEATLSSAERLVSIRHEQNLALKRLKGSSVWGDFDQNTIGKLAEAGIALHYYCVPKKKYDAQWEQDHAITVVDDENGSVWFVVAAPSAEPYEFPAEELAAPEISLSEAEQALDALHEDEINHKAVLLYLKRNKLEHMRAGLRKHTAELDKYLAGVQGNDAAEGHICTFEGYAPSEDDERLKKEFDRMGILYLSAPASEEDNPPIKLVNTKFSSLFECLTGMYGMPVYGEWDPTPVLSIFFMLFFAMCMGDAGYGLILIIYGILQDRKIINISMFDGLGKLITVLGVATTVVGFFLGTAFGIDLTAAEWIPEGLRSLMFTGDMNIAGSQYAVQMVLALVIGVVHLSLAMIIKAVLYTQRFGFKANISTWGWLLLILGGIITAICAGIGLLSPAITTYMLIAIGSVSALAIFIFNKPGRNPLLNIGAGLWDTYNMATGILGDVLSYIRLYALGLAGGMLGGAFNNLGGMVLGSNPTWQWIPFVLILLFGHVLNLLMSCLGAFVHPLRLTFVEYFKNSGYEGKGRIYNALKK